METKGCDQGGYAWWCQVLGESLPLELLNKNLNAWFQMRSDRNEAYPGENNDQRAPVPYSMCWSRRRERRGRERRRRGGGGGHKCTTTADLRRMNNRILKLNIDMKNACMLKNGGATLLLAVMSSV